MTAKIISGREVAENILTDLKKRVDMLKEKSITPKLVVVLVGDMKASASYVAQKEKFAVKAGIHSEVLRFNSKVSESNILDQIDKINMDNNIHGVIVQLPLPDHISVTKVLNRIDPKKDVDGFTPTNVGKLFLGEETLVSCTPKGIMSILESTGTDLSGKNVTVIGRSNIVGKPMSQLLIEESCTVTVVHSKTKNVEAICSQADVVVVAAGRPEMVNGDWLKEGAVVIDVGINRVPVTKEDGSEGSKIVGDVDFESASSKASKITPVPGGVGPMTIACLLRNTVTSAYRHAGLGDPRGTVDSESQDQYKEKYINH